MISVRRISLGGGFRYLMESVAVADGAPRPVGDLARYYAESGTPPGRFMGSGLVDLDGGRGLPVGRQADEEHLRRMLGECRDPISGVLVGRPPRTSGKVAAVAGFDLCFSPPKSVSVAWAMADPATKEEIYRCHQDAVSYVLKYAERNVLRSRSGTNGIVEEDTCGAIAVSFTHWESRSGDPQLHNHVVVWNRARSVSDGAWRTLDSRSLFKARSALSSLHQGVLQDLLTARLGYRWETRAGRSSTRVGREIAGVPQTLLREFSRRSEQITAAKDDLIAKFTHAHGRAPTGIEMIRMRQQATLFTRPAKVHSSLKDLTATWRHRATGYVDRGPEGWAGRLARREKGRSVSATHFTEETISRLANWVLEETVKCRSTFGRFNLVDHAHRALHGYHFDRLDDRVWVAERIADAALAASINLTAPPLFHTPSPFVRDDGSDRLHPESRRTYTTRAILDAEAHLLAAGRRLDAPTATVSAGSLGRLSYEQSDAVAKIARSGRRVDVLVGPAGAGKSTTMAGLRHAWESIHGPGSVIGLAPSAAAAEVLGDEIQIPGENTAKWITEAERIPKLAVERERLARTFAANGTNCRGRVQLAEMDRMIAARRFRSGQLVIIDEAGMASTPVLDYIIAAATAADAKVVLVGDWAQLGAVGAGGAFGLLARDHQNHAELCDIRRFAHPWEKSASVELRSGSPAAIDAYDSHQRISEGTREEMLERVLAAWQADCAAGRSAVMVASHGSTVADLNTRAREWLAANRLVGTDETPVSGGQVAGAGDEIVTRRNARALTTNQNRWVRNGDRWTVIGTRPDGSITARSLRGAGQITLPTDYVGEHVELAYATTTQRCQGRTVDTAHVIVDAATTREALYVAATRGRDSNHIYVDVGYDPDPATGHPQTMPAHTGRDVLHAILANTGSELSAHETLRHNLDSASSIAALEAAYNTIAQEAQKQRWDQLLQASGLNLDQLRRIQASAAYGPLQTALRTAEASGLDVETVVPRLINRRTLDDADDIAAVIHGRVERWTHETPSQQGSNMLISGLIPKARRITDPEMVTALTEVTQVIEGRARSLAEQAIATQAPWIEALGMAPTDGAHLRVWRTSLTTIAAYRDRWGITSPGSAGLDQPPQTSDQLAHVQRARQALRKARGVAEADQRSRTASAGRSLSAAAGVPPHSL